MYNYVLLDAPTLFESKADNLCDIIVSVIADREIRIERILKRDSITLDEAESRLNSQKNDDFYIEKTWENGEKTISYSQSTTNASIIIDKDYEIIYIDDQEIYLTQSEYSYCLTWANDFGIFGFTCSKPIPWEEVEAIFRSITPIEETPADPE